MKLIYIYSEYKILQSYIYLNYVVALLGYGTANTVGMIRCFGISFRSNPTILVSSSLRMGSKRIPKHHIIHTILNHVITYKIYNSSSIMAKDFDHMHFNIIMSQNSLRNWLKKTNIKHLCRRCFKVLSPLGAHRVDKFRVPLLNRQKPKRPE
jgi:hypothetical protein